MVQFCEKCTNYKEDSVVSTDMSQEECLKFCTEASQCLGVSVGRTGKSTFRECWQITELPDDGWETPDTSLIYDTWKKSETTDVPTTAAPTTAVPTTVAPTTAQEDSLRGCGLAVMDKCYQHNPPDGSLPGNLIEEIGAVQNATTCQQFCKELYNNSCEWFMYDRRTTDCKLFRGSLSDLEEDCAESGYAIRPSYNDCTVTNVMKHDGCYNFREDYCRFEFTLLDNLESIEKIEDCQTACKYLTNCTFFIYDGPSKICKVNTDPFDKRICDIVHGSKDPSLQQCLDDGKIPWTSKVVSTG